LELKKTGGKYETVLEDYFLGRISQLSTELLKRLNALETAVFESGKEQEIISEASAYCNKVFPAMEGLRSIVDELETIVAKKHWPLPSYAALLYGVL